MTTPASAASIDDALELDAHDELAAFRDEFEIPAAPDGRACRYLAGHSLGLMPRAARAAVVRELDRWSRRGVAGHFDGDSGWYAYHERFAAPLARLLGAEAREVVAMSSLTVNLHLMLVSFFAPRGERRRIVIERGAFPSDRFAVESHLRFHGLDPARDLVEIGGGGANATTIEAEALDALLEAQGERVDLVLLPGVQYLTGQAIDLAACAEVARRHGCRIGFDLAHAIGNLALDLRAAEPDFAVWCSYKYLNAGPGAVGGLFVNRRWHGERGLPRFEGWWGHDKARRFAPAGAFAPIESAEAWQLSNPPILAMAPLDASLALFAAAGIERLRRKAAALTAFLEALLDDACGERIALLTPRDPAARGSQLSLKLGLGADETARLVETLASRGIVADWRPPDVLRLAPAPLYNSFADAAAAAQVLAGALAR